MWNNKTRMHLAEAVHTITLSEILDYSITLIHLPNISVHTAFCVSPQQINHLVYHVYSSGVHWDIPSFIGPERHPPPLHCVLGRTGELHWGPRSPADTWLPTPSHLWSVTGICLLKKTDWNMPYYLLECNTLEMIGKSLIRMDYIVYYK